MEVSLISLLILGPFLYTLIDFMVPGLMLHLLLRKVDPLKTRDNNLDISWDPPLREDDKVREIIWYILSIG